MLSNMLNYKHDENQGHHIPIPLKNDISAYLFPTVESKSQISRFNVNGVEIVCCLLQLFNEFYIETNEIHFNFQNNDFNAE